MELPQYTMYLSLRRILIPKAFALLFLGAFFYLGIFLNLIILNIYIPPDIHLYIIIGILILVVMQAILNYLKYSSYTYLFYRDRMIFQGKKELVLLYSDIENLEFKQDAIDKLFNTGTINLVPKHKMKYVENTNQVYFYIQKLIHYQRQTAYYTPPSQNTYANSQPYYTQQIR